MDFFLGNFQGEVISCDGFTLGNYINTNKLSKPRLYLLSKCKTNLTGSGKDNLQVPHSDFTPKQYEQDCNLKVEDDPMLLDDQPVFASTPIPDDRDQHRVYELSDDSENEVAFKDFGSLDACPWLLEDTLMDPIIPELDDNQHTSVIQEPVHEEEKATYPKCEICLEEIRESSGVNPVGCLDIFHEECLREWQKTGENGTIKFPVCQNEFKDIVTQCRSHQQDVVLLSTQAPSPTNPSEENGLRIAPSADLHEESSECEESDEGQRVEPQTKRRATADANRGYQFRQSSLPQLLGDNDQTKNKANDTEKTIPKRRIEAFSTLCDQGNSRSVTINRETIVQDMLNLYNEKSTVESLLNVTFVNEPAMDLNGVKREAFTLFWEKVMPLYFEGTTTYVPRISPAIDESIYTALGRIMSHGYVMVGIFPTLISETFFTALVAGKEYVTEEDFLDGFLDFVSSYDKLRLQNIIGECSTQQSLSASSTDFLLDFLSEFNVSKMPNKDNVRSILVSVAKTELWNKTVMAADSLKEGLFEGVASEKVWPSATKDLVVDLYKSLQVTTDKALSLIVIDDPSALSKGQDIVFTYFKKYVRSLNENELSCFLRYVTGSSAIVVPSIKVIFHAHVGNLPHVTVHACSAVVDLPSGGYDSFTDFKSQMDEVLKNAESWKFSLV
ncbi:uncharacterized protein LOC144652258 [Oculina patagonica]